MGDKRDKAVVLLVLGLILVACGGNRPAVTVADDAKRVQGNYLELATADNSTSGPPSPVIPSRYTYRIVKTYPHNSTSYTQGLYWHDGYLYEGTGQNGQSALMQVNINTGKAVKTRSLPEEYFGEGIAMVGGRIYQLTWQSNKGFIYDAADFAPVGEFLYNGEGWGLTTDGTLLYMSDGSNRIHVIDPKTMKKTRTIKVMLGREQVEYLNELEWIRGEIWANVYTTDMVVRIDPKTGSVIGIVDLSGLLKKEDIQPDTDVLNGIAYDNEADKIYVTGKNWSKLFEIEVVKTE